VERGLQAASRREIICMVKRHKCRAPAGIFAGVEGDEAQIKNLPENKK